MRDAPLIGCPFCGKRRATKLCDAPTARYHFIGHPPRASISRDMTGRWFFSVPMEGVYTCDRPICDECAVTVGPEIDFCPRCIDRTKIKAAEKWRK